MRTPPTRNEPDDPWVLALDRAAGLDAGREPLPAGLLAFAERLLAAGRRVEALPRCPAAALRRAVAVVGEAGAPARGSLWSLLFDSWTAAAPALRGASTSRFLRCGGEGGTIDVEMGETESGALRLRGTVDATATDLALDVVLDGVKPLRVPVRPGGLFEATVPPSSRGFTLTLRSGRRAVAHTPPLPPPE